MVVKLDMMQTAALAAIIFYFGGYVKSKVPILYKFCIPVPVVGRPIEGMEGLSALEKTLSWN